MRLKREPNLRKILKERFSVKLFVLVTIFTFVISLAFTVFFYRHQSRSLTDRLVKNNLLLAGILAYNSRLGVFSEDEVFLENPVDALFQQAETLEVSIYNQYGELLKRRERPAGRAEQNPPAGQKEQSMEPGIFDRLRASTSPFYLDQRTKMAFWSPVIASAGYESAEALFIEEQPRPGAQRVIGFVRITVGKSVLRKKLGALLANSVLMVFIFWIAGSLIVYFLVQRIVNPLNTLITGVKALEKGNFGETVPVQTDDEIGKLAAAFNHMSETLMKRETEKRQLEEQLRHSQRMEAIGTMAGGIAHDFNNILGIILGYAQMAMLTAPDGSDMQRSSGEIYKASIRARDLVKQILTFSRQDTQERHPLLVKPLIEEALKMMRASLPAAVDVRTHIKSGLSPILSDPTQINQVLINLCTNAGHAMEDRGGILDVNLEEEEIGVGDPALSPDMQPGRYQILTVSDTGHGMDASIRERIFDPFFTTKGPGKGTGMGLAVVHGIVKSHGGKIVCRSQPGKGAVFEVFFPAIKDNAPLQVEKADAIPQGSERVLFVDDEAALAEISRQMLQSLGYRVAARTSSIEALEAFRSRPDQFDLLITDNFMPNMTGLELAQAIRRIRPDIPIIFCTGFSEGISEERMEAMGRVELSMKPIIRENLAKLIRRLLD